jgi:FMN phosphatase YigB (HAD superfamily)
MNVVVDLDGCLIRNNTTTDVVREAGVLWIYKILRRIFRWLGFRGNLFDRLIVFIIIFFKPNLLLNVEFEVNDNLFGVLSDYGGKVAIITNACPIFRQRLEETFPHIEVYFTSTTLIKPSKKNLIGADVVITDDPITDSEGFKIIIDIRLIEPSLLAEVLQSCHKLQH